MSNENENNTNDPWSGTAYSIDQALELMRSLPTEGLNEQLIIQVIRNTLMSAGIDIPSLLATALERQEEVTREIVRLQGEISTFNQEIAHREAQVAHYQEQLAELGDLRERFEENS